MKNKLFITAVMICLAVWASSCVKPVEACFEYSPTAGITIDTFVVFDASCTQNGGYSYTWNFGDGTPDTLLLGEPVVTHRFDTIGTFTVTLTAGRRDGVVWSEGDKQTIQEVVTVQ